MQMADEQPHSGDASCEGVADFLRGSGGMTMANIEMVEVLSVFGVSTSSMSNGRTSFPSRNADEKRAAPISACWNSESRVPPDTKTRKTSHRLNSSC